MIDETIKKYKLSECCNLLGHKVLTDKYGKVHSGNFPRYGANGIIDYIDTYAFDGDYILMGRNGSTSNDDGTPVLNLVSGKFSTDHTHVIQENGICKLKYLYYFLQTINVTHLIEGRAIKTEKVKNINILVPPLETQQKIINILDKFNELQQELQQELLLRDKQFKYYLNYLLSNDNLNSGEREIIEKYIKYLKGIHYDKQDEIQDETIEHYKLLRGNNITINNTLDLNKEIKLIRKDSKKLKFKDENYLRKKDILFVTASCNYLGKCAYIDNDINYTYSGFMGLLRLKDGIDNFNMKYLYYYMCSKYFRDYIYDNVNGTTLNNLNNTIINNFKINLPDIDTQQRIVNILDKLSDYYNNTNTGLLKEKEFREKQYKYYLNKLLTFKNI